MVVDSFEDGRRIRWIHESRKYILSETDITSNIDSAIAWNWEVRHVPEGNFAGFTNQKASGNTFDESVLA